VDELLVRVTAPVTDVVVEGSKLTVSVAVWPSLRVSGKITPDILNPAPVSVPALMMSGAVPEEVRMTDLLTDVFTVTLPKARVLVLRLRVGMKAFSWSWTVLEAVPEAAVRVADCVVVTESIVAKKATLVALAGTVTVAGSVTAGLLLERLTFSPPLPAAALRNTVQESVPDPVMEALAQESAFSVPGAAIPVPLSVTAIGLVEELLVKVIAPVTAPMEEGSKLTVSFAVCPWLRVSGKLAPDMLKPAPVTVPALMVSGAVPVEVRVTDCGVADVFTVTLPKARLLVLSLKVGVLALSARAKVLETVPAVAVRVAVCAVVTEATVAEKATLVALAGTVTVAGRVTETLLLERLTLSPPVPAAALRVTVQTSVPAPVIEALMQLSALSAPGVAVPVPLRLITADGFVEELLARESAPVTAPMAAGSKLTVSVAVCPGLRVSGKLAPDMLKPAPVSVPALMVSGAVPEEVRVTDCGVAAVFTVTLPKAMLPVLRLRVLVLAFSARAKVLEMVPAVAVRVAVCAVVTEVTAAEKATPVELAGTVTVAGRVTAGSLLERLTRSPPLPAAAARVTVQASVPAPVIEPGVQERALSVPGAAVPVPPRLITADGLVVELLVRVIAPVAAPAVVGSKLTVSVADCPWLRISGKLAPGMLKPVPVSVPALMVSGAVPEEVKVTDSGVAAVPTVTLPKAMLAVLSFKCGV
jgi:hypothetical protein